MQRSVVSAAILACMLAMLFPAQKARAHDGHRRLAVLEQTLLTVERGESLRVPALAATDNTVFGPERLRGHWSVIFFGFTSCPDVCPTTLGVLGALARDPGSGVAAGTTQIVFVSIDPERDTLKRVKSYLKPFGTGIVGLTGSRDAIDRFSAALGAAYRPAGAGIDHSTSLFVVDPQGRLAGILLRPSDPARIVADLRTLRTTDTGHPHASPGR